jgi:FkbM family methyltransferase
MHDAKDRVKGFLGRLSAVLRQPSPPAAGEANPSPLMRHVDARKLYPRDRLVRLGTQYGGWLIPADCGLSRESVCYLAGAGEDLSFDCEIARRFHCKVRIIDPTPRAVQHFHQLAQATTEGRRFPVNNSQTEFYSITASDLACMTFLAIGLAGEDGELKFYLPRNPAHVSCSTLNLHKTEDYFTAQCRRLSTVMAQQGDRQVDLIKMDIEGAEYSVIQDMVASRLLPDTLLIEFDEAHTPLDGDAESRIGDHIRRLVQAGMRCVAVEGSNATFVWAR